MAKEKKEEEKTTFQEFGEKYLNVKEYQSGLEDVADGKGNNAVPRLVQKVLIENSALSEQESGRLWDGVKTELQNYYVTSPYLDEGLRKETDRFREFGGRNLEGILKSTPGEFMEQIFMRHAPGEEHPVRDSSYEEIGELHKRMVKMSRVLGDFKKPELGESKKGELISGIKGDLKEYYKKQYKVEDTDDEKTAADKKAALKFFTSIIDYKKDEIGRFAIETYTDVLEEVRGKFHEKVKGKEIDYLRAYLNDEEILSVYTGMFDGMTKRKE